jgi:Ca-activated chloride channel family protein
MAYGHRRKKDCSDIELLIDPKPDTAIQITKTVNALNPLGETPMGDSVRKAAEILKFKKQKATIILVSDGIETCGADLCALGKELEKEGIDFTTHIIGFGLKEAEVAPMRCMAEETGGTFTLADSAEALDEALGEVMTDSACEGVEDAHLTYAPEVAVDSTFKVQFDTIPKVGDIIAIVRPGGDTKDALSTVTPKSYIKRGKAPIVAPHEAGDYELVYRSYCGKNIFRSALKVAEADVSLTFPSEVSTGARFNISWQGPNTVGDLILLVPKGKSGVGDKLSSFAVASHKKTSSYHLTAPSTPGEYDIIYLSSKRKVLKRSHIIIK